MTATLQPSGRRAGATWVAAVGAFLLVAAAGVFVAVRWNRLTATGRLAMVVAVTGGCLAGGRWLRRTLPSTGDVLFHLGAFLLPIDLAAAILQAGLGWRDLLLTEGVLAAGALGGLGLVTGSVVLVWAGVVGVAVLAGGVAGFTPLSAPVVLALIAAGAELAGRGRSRPLRSGHAGRGPVVWAALAGLAPLLGAAACVVAGSLADRLGAGTLADLGLSGSASVGGAAAAGVLAAAVLARRARRDHDVLLAFAAMASVLIAAGTTILTPDLPPEVRAVGIAAIFALAELLAFALLHDPFWARPLHVLAVGMEVAVGGVAAVLAAIVLLAAPYVGAADLVVEPCDRVLAATLAICALAWLTADQRRYRGTPRPAGIALVRGGGWALGGAAVALHAVAAVELATSSGPATAVALLAVAGLAVVCRRPGADAIAAVAGPWAVLSVVSSPLAGALAGVAGAAVTGLAAVRRAAEEARAGASVLVALSAITTVGLGAGVVARAVRPTVAVAGTAVALWLLAVLLDRPAWPERKHRRVSLGDLARGALLVTAGVALLVAPRSTLLGVAVVTILLVFDAIRMDRPEVGCGAGLAVQAVVVEVGLGAGLPVAGVGVALCVGAVAWSGLAVVVDERWRLPFLLAAGAGVWGGVWLASIDAAYLSSAFLVTGTLLASAGLYAGRAVAAHAGGALVCLGLAGHLGVAGVELPEAYLAPVAAQLAFAGWQARRSWPLSSWVAYGPAVALLGGVALAERLTGGGGEHAVIAGGVGVVAVAVGGWRRLLAALFLGTLLVVVLAVYESLSALAGVPTWAWLATAGAVLLTVGIVLERSDSTPTEVGRRLVDVLAERYG